MDKLSSLTEAISNLNEAEVEHLVRERLDAGVPAVDILADCRAGMAVVGSRFEKGEYFIPELMFAGTIMKGVMADLEPMLKQLRASREEAASVVIGTVRHDIHDIGKDVVVIMLQGTGFDVVDLGVDVSPQRFVESTKESHASVLGMSVFLTSCCKFVAETVDAVKQAGLRDRVSIMIGGAAASGMVAERTGCDYYGETAVDAVNYASKVVKSLSENC